MKLEGHGLGKTEEKGEKLQGMRMTQRGEVLTARETAWLGEGEDGVGLWQGEREEENFGGRNTRGGLSVGRRGKRAAPLGSPETWARSWGH